MDYSLLRNSNVKIKFNVPLSKNTTFKLGGVCPIFLQCQTPTQLLKTVKFLRATGQDFVLIGEGSNIIVSDQGVSCPVIKYASPRLAARIKNDTVTVWASSFLDELANLLASEGWSGINFISGIPGTVGGAITGNAGAFGKQIGDVVESIRVLSLDNSIQTIYAKDLDFSYRNSIIKTSGYIILSATLRLVRADRVSLLTERQEILEQRRQKHPDYQVTPCAGSFFRNLEPTSLAGRRQAAGWFLDQCGAKTMTYGGAAVFPKHANIIINPGSASAADVYSLSLKMAAAVKEKFNIDLSREVSFVGKINDSGLENKFW